MYIKLISIILKMTYNDSNVVIGGLVHIPIIIVILRFIESKFKKNVIHYKVNL